MQAHSAHSGARALAYALAASSAAAMLYVGLYQSRAVQHLWCPLFGCSSKFATPNALPQISRIAPRNPTNRIWQFGT